MHGTLQIMFDQVGSPFSCYLLLFFEFSRDPERTTSADYEITPSNTHALRRNLP